MIPMIHTARVPVRSTSDCTLTMCTHVYRQRAICLNLHHHKRTLMLGQRRRRWASIEPSLSQRLVFDGIEHCTDPDQIKGLRTLA